MGVAEVQSKVQRIVADAIGSVRVNAEGTFFLEFESAVGMIKVVDWGDDDTIVKVGSLMLRDVELTPQVYEWVATEGQAAWFAHARVFKDSDNPRRGSIAWEYDILGNFLDADELMHVVRSVVGGANRHDDELQKRFGGRRGVD